MGDNSIWNVYWSLVILDSFTSIYLVRFSTTLPLSTPEFERSSISATWNSENSNYNPPVRTFRATLLSFTEALDTASMERRHIQNTSEATQLIPHWGYVDRVYPCTNDAGTCEYLDAVYWMHDISMLYTFIMWMALAGIFALWILFRCMKPANIPTVSKTGEQLSCSTSDSIDNAFYRGTRAFAASTRRYLLPESSIRYFGHVTRLQLLILAILVGYLAIFRHVYSYILG